MQSLKKLIDMENLQDNVQENVWYHLPYMQSLHHAYVSGCTENHLEG